MLKIQEVCKEKAVTMQSLAKDMGVTYQALHATVTGNPTVGMLKKIADALGVTVLDLFERSDEVRLFAEYNSERHEITHADIIGIIEQRKHRK